MFMSWASAAVNSVTAITPQDSQEERTKLEAQASHHASRHHWTPYEGTVHTELNQVEESHP